MKLWLKPLQVSELTVHNRAVFISDLHLAPDQVEVKQLFLDFLAKLKAGTTVYILGDLFKFWIGDDDQSIFNQEIKAALSQAATRAKIYLMAGNRDFLLGSRFASESGVVLIADPHLIKLNGKLTLLTHGDCLTNTNLSYQWFRVLIRNKWLIKVFLLWPRWWRRWLAVLLQTYSARRKQHSANKPSTDMIIPQEMVVKTLLQQMDFEQIIYGHVHVAGKGKLTIAGRKITYFSLKEWRAQSAGVLWYP